MDAPNPPHWTLNRHFGAFCTIWVHFRNERTRSTQLDPKLMFGCVSYYLGAFVTVWLPYESRCKTGRTSAKVRATKSHWNFSQTNAPNPLHWTLDLRFGAFRTIWLHSGLLGRTSAKVRATKSRRNFSQQTHPILPIGP